MPFPFLDSSAAERRGLPIIRSRVLVLRPRRKEWAIRKQRSFGRVLPFGLRFQDLDHDIVHHHRPMSTTTVRRRPTFDCVEAERDEHLLVPVGDDDEKKENRHRTGSSSSLLLLSQRDSVGVCSFFVVGWIVYISSLLPSAAGWRSFLWVPVLFPIIITP